MVSSYDNKRKEEWRVGDCPALDNRECGCFVLGVSKQWNTMSDPKKNFERHFGHFLPRKSSG